MSACIGRKGFFATRQVKPGDTFSYYTYEPEITLVAKTNVTVKDFEDLEVPGSAKTQSLLRVEAQGEKIQGFQPPKEITWLDKERMPVRSQVDMPGLGKMVLIRTTRELAQAKNSAIMTNIGSNQLIALNRRILRPYDTQAVVYKITIKDDEDPATAFAQDGRQEVKNIKGHTVEMRVQALREPQTVEKPAKVKDEYLKSCYFINSEDAKVQELARLAVGRETDSWEKAKRIESWVHNNMRETNYSNALATADHVAKNLEGDCTEYAMLTAAICRAAGVPSRTAIGLLYVDSDRGPGMGFHMWTEVYVQGQWMSIDATLGRGYVGASHLKISDHSWYETQSLTPLLPVLRVLGKISIEVASVTSAE